MTKISVDQPITSSSEDILGRTSIAESFVRRVLRLNAKEGLVVGVMGPWGTGKTSFLNLTKNFFGDQQSPVIFFNPWLFSGAQQLVDKFFEELSAELRMRSLTVESEALRAYGDALAGFDWIPVGGTWFKFLGGVFKLISSGIQPKGINAIRDKVRVELAKLKCPIVVVIDDMDRLSTEEIRDIFRLVRLTASFPNIIYILSFDRVRVEQALKQDGLEGRAYLEKILQLGYELPLIPDVAMQSNILKAIEYATRSVMENQRFDEVRWPDIFIEIIRPLVRHMRDLNRYAAHIQGVVEELGGRVALEDVLAIEAVRVFLPDTYGLIVQNSSDLTSIQWISSSEKDVVKGRLQGIIDAAGNQRDLVESLFDRVFPATRSSLGDVQYSSSPGIWSRGRQLADVNVFDYYLTRVEGDALVSANRAEQAFEILANGGDFASFMNSIKPSELEDVIAALEAYESEFKPEMIEPGATALLNLLSAIPERQRGFFEFDAGISVRRTVLRLLRAEEDEDARANFVFSILTNVKMLSARLTLLSLVGHHPNSGHKLIPQKEFEEFERYWRDHVRAASREQLAQERDLLDITLVARATNALEEPEIELPSGPEVSYALLRSALTETKSQSGDQRFIKRTQRLRWKPLLEVAGGEDALRLRVDEARLVANSGDQIIKLADKHLNGWDPSSDE
ncbi:MAG: KAP family P-loop NTPase fold protein [Stenotrophomonas sp.]